MANLTSGDLPLVDTPVLWKRPAFLAFSIILLTTLARLWFVASHQLDLVQDEAQYWDWSRHLQLSYYSKGPLVAYLIALGTAVFGNTELGVRICAVAASVLVQAACYAFLAVLCRRPREAVWTLVVINTAPMFLANSVLMTTDSPLALCWVGALFSMHWAAFGRKRSLALVLVGLCMALGILAKYTMVAFGLTALLYVWGLRRNGILPQGFTVRLGVALVLGVLAGALPILLWNLDNDFVSFRHVATLAGMAETEGQPLLRLSTLPEYLGSQIGLITPWWFLLLLLEAWRTGRRVLLPGRGRPGERAVQDAEPTGGKGLDTLLVMGFWPGFLFFLVWSLHAKIYPNWSGICYVAGALLAARGAEGVMERFRDPAARGRWKRRALVVCVGLGALCFVLMHLQNWLPAPETVNPMQRLKGWESLGREVRHYQETAFADPGRVFFFSDEYDITAALAFYIPGQPRTFCAFVDRRMCQYDLWPGPEDRIGWDAIYVRKRFKGMSEYLRSLFESVEDVEFQSYHRGQPARKFTITLCRNFRGPWPLSTGTHF